MRKFLYGNGGKKIIWILFLFFAFVVTAVLLYISGNLRAFVIDSPATQLAESSESLSGIQLGVIVTTGEGFGRYYINLEEVFGAKTLTTPASCVPPAVLKAYPDMPKNWEFLTKCGRSFMNHSIHSDRAAMAKSGISQLDERILLVGKSIKDVTDQKISKINDLPAGEGMPIGEIISAPYEGASLSTQCVKDSKGQVISFAMLVGKYNPNYSSISGYSPIQQDFKFGSMSSKNQVVLISTTAKDELRFLGLTISAGITDTGERCGLLNSWRLYDYEFGPFSGNVCSPEITVSEIIADTNKKLGN